MNALAPWAAIQTDKEPALKKAFALELLRNPDNPYQAALKLFPGFQNSGRAAHVARDWLHDPDVLAEQQKLLDERGDEAFLPTLAETARHVFDLAKRDNISVGESLASYRLYAEMRGFLKKDIGTQVNVQNNVVNKVMKVVDHGTDEEWEAKIKAGQMKLIAGARG